MTSDLNIKKITLVTVWKKKKKNIVRGKGGSRETGQEAVAITQVGDTGGLDENSYRADGVKWSGSSKILKLEQTAFTHQSDGGSEGKRGVKDDSKLSGSFTKREEEG